MTRDARLAHFQAVLLQLLSEPLSAQEVVARLLADSSLADYHAYVAGFEPRMVEVAALLVKKWGQRHEGEHQI